MTFSFFRSAPTLEKPSAMSEESADSAATDRISNPLSFQILENLKKEKFGGNPEEEENRKKRKRKGKKTILINFAPEGSFFFLAFQALYFN